MEELGIAELFRKCSEPLGLMKGRVGTDGARYIITMNRLDVFDVGVVRFDVIGLHWAALGLYEVDIHSLEGARI